MNRFLIPLLMAAMATTAYGQGTVDDYKRAFAAPQTFSSQKVYHAPRKVTWNGAEHRFYYSIQTSEGERFVVVDAEKQTKTSCASMNEVRTNLGLPAPAEDKPNARKRKSQSEWQHINWASDPADDFSPVDSPDGKCQAYVKNYNLYVLDLATQKERCLTNDGGLGFYYSNRLQWSPDSKYIASTKLRRVEKHSVSFVESSPVDQLQPKLHTMEYAKPGDALDYQEPRIVEVATGKTIVPSNALFANQFSLGNLRWLANGKELLFDYNERGHKVYRVLALDATTGVVRTVVEETSAKFVNYNRQFCQLLNGDKELIWMSERDNHNHLYLYDLQKGKVKHQITRGDWYVRDVLKVDETAGVIYFTANGLSPEGKAVSEDEDPYLIRYFRIDLSGKNLKCLTPEMAQHSAQFSQDMKYFVDTYSRADVPPVSVLRSVTDGKVVMSLETADISALTATGWRAPEVFHAPGRDGKTEMWGLIHRPTNFDPSKSYPVIEYIYAGPGSAYTPKDFISYNWTATSLAEIGFIVVQLDAMGTSFRSKAFEEVCYKNLKDAGFPDRIEWIKAAAKKYPYMDANRVGIYGCSAGGQESTTAVLLHPEFYKAAYSACGCHDNRMDKVWWNEQWLGYPVDSSYVACSNVENAHLLTRPLMLLVGEMDDNVDPATTMQVANALIKAKKDFELVVIPGARHTMGESYGEHKRYDFFVKNLMGQNAPKWSDVQ